MEVVFVFLFQPRGLRFITVFETRWLVVHLRDGAVIIETSVTYHITCSKGEIKKAEHKLLANISDYACTLQCLLPVGQICCCLSCMWMKLLKKSRTRPKQCDPEAASWQALCIISVVALQGRLHVLPTDPCEEKVGNVRKPRSTMEMTAIRVWGATSAPSAKSCILFFLKADHLIA